MNISRKINRTELDSFELANMILRPLWKINQEKKTEKKTRKKSIKTRRTAVREAGVSIDITGDQLGAPLKPPVHHITMILRGLMGCSQLFSHYAKR